MKTYKVIDQVFKYRFGNPFETEAVVIKGETCDHKALDYFSVSKADGITFKYEMDTTDIVFGLGENIGGMNKRGRLFESYCTDNPNHTPDVKSLYGAHNFLLIDGKIKFGVFVDYPTRVVFDIGFTNKDELVISTEKPDLDLYIIHGDSLRTITKSFLKIIGTSYIPPKWAFGYQQSRWSYPDAKSIEEVANRFNKNDIPCDTIYLDIDYMERFKDFTINKESFPEFKSFVSKMKEQGIRLIPIIDAGVKIEEDYSVYEEGIKNKYFCTDENDQAFVAAVWPGRCHFPDFLNADVRKWFGGKYKVLTDMGIEGFWNDMNEPTIFYSEKGIKEAIDLVKESENKNLDIYSFFDLKDKFTNIMNSDSDYKSFYHTVNNEKVNHYDVHNLYGYNMTKAASEGFEEIDENKRFLMFSRASYVGMHRYGGIWTGDNHSWWEHLILNIKMMPALNFCGFLYSGADTGGFSADASSSLITRWIQFSLFTPLFRNHSVMGSRSQEPYGFEEDSLATIREAIRFRYALIPYLYSEYMKVAINSDVLFAPLTFEYKDKISRHTEDQLLVGDSIMIAPIYEENVIGRNVWLPEKMLLWKVENYKKRNYEVIEKGHNFIEVELEEFPLFIRKNKILVLGSHAKNVDSIDQSKKTVIAFIETIAEYTLYDDDGESKKYLKGESTEINIKIEKNGTDYTIDIVVEGDTEVKELNFEIVDEEGQLFKTKRRIDY